MNIFPLHLMETLKCWSSVYAYIVMVLFLTAVSKGSACEAPSSPQCFRKYAADSVYKCEWSMNGTQSNVTFYIYFNETKFRCLMESCTFPEEQLIRGRTVHIWVKAHVGDSSCESPRTTVVLSHTVKYDAPQNIAVSWIKNNLSLIWKAAEMHPALAEIRYQQYVHPRGELWDITLTNTTYETLKYQAIVRNLSKHSAYLVQIRHRSTQAQNPLWSNWSEVFIPAELEHEPDVTMTTKHLNGTRMVTLTWKPMPYAAAFNGVTYSLNDTQSKGCPCVKRKPHIYENITTTSIYVSYSAVNISISAKNTAGYSPPAIIQVPSEPVVGLKTCDNILLEKLNNKACHEFYEFQDEDSRPINVITLSRKTRKKQRDQITNNIKNYVRYLYFEHRCFKKEPQTLKMCIFYQKEGAPQREPQDFIAFGETHTSVSLSWKGIPLVEQRGVLTHFRLCSEKISSQDKSKKCHNISASEVNCHLENLTPGSKYNISLAGVTRVGEGPKATVTINTLPEKPLNVWLSFGLLFGFFLFSSLCTVILKRIKNKIFPPVPMPVILDFNPHQPESQEMLEEKEEVHELMLLQLHPEVKPVSEDAEESSVLCREWDDGANKDVENVRGDSRMSGGMSHSDEGPDSTEQTLRNSGEGEMTDLEQVDNEIAMLIYRNGLVFDLKTDSP